MNATATADAGGCELNHASAAMVAIIAPTTGKMSFRLRMTRNPALT